MRTSLVATGALLVALGCSGRTESPEAGPVGAASPVPAVTVGPAEIGRAHV